MKKMTNESGYALLMVMMLMMLFTVIGLGLLATNINASKQSSLKEDQVQARHQAEMGVMHYSALLQERFERSSTVNLQCSDIESLLGSSKKLSFSNYEVRPGSPAEPSCKKIGNTSMEITIISKGTINETTEKEVKATFFATAQRPPSTTPKPPAVPEKAVIQENIEQRKKTEEFFGNLIVNKNIIIGGGATDNIKTHKDFYVYGGITLQNHACLSSAGSMTVLGDIDMGSSNTNIIVRKDIHLPPKIILNRGAFYIYGDVYLPTVYEYGNNLHNKPIYVGGKVYQKTGEGYKEINNPFKPLAQKNMDEASKLGCYIEPYWTLLSNKNVVYQ